MMGSWKKCRRAHLGMFLLAVTLAGCGSVDEWRLRRQQQTWDRRVAEAAAESGVWMVRVPGVVGYVYPAGIEAQATQLMLTDVLMTEWVLRREFRIPDLCTPYPAAFRLRSLDGFVRQYKGFRDNAGKLHVHVNAVPGDMPGGRGWIVMKDGGPGYWNAWVEVDGARLYALQFNGEA